MTSQSHTPTPLDRYESVTGEEMPRKMVRILNPVRLSLAEFWNLKAKSVGPSWGSAVNNPCNLYQTSDGRWIEEYNAQGMPSYWIEAIAKAEGK